MANGHILQEGALKASLMIGDMPYKEQGVVDFLSARLDEKTGSLKARASFKNPLNDLLPNQFVKVSLLGLTRNNVIKVPQKQSFKIHLVPLCSL